MKAPQTGRTMPGHPLQPCLAQTLLRPWISWANLNLRPVLCLPHACYLCHLGGEMQPPSCCLRLPPLHPRALPSSPMAGHPQTASGCTSSSFISYKHPPTWQVAQGHDVVHDVQEESGTRKGGNDKELREDVFQNTQI